MTSRVVLTCNRCGINAKDTTGPWLRLTVLPGEDDILNILNAPDNVIDLCIPCEQDLINWLAQPLTEKAFKRNGDTDETAR
jgi:hypothetical protein